MQNVAEWGRLILDNLRGGKLCGQNAFIKESSSCCLYYLKNNARLFRRDGLVSGRAKREEGLALAFARRVGNVVGNDVCQFHVLQWRSRPVVVDVGRHCFFFWRVVVAVLF